MTIPDAKGCHFKRVAKFFKKLIYRLKGKKRGALRGDANSIKCFSAKVNISYVKENFTVDHEWPLADFLTITNSVAILWRAPSCPMRVAEKVAETLALASTPGKWPIVSYRAYLLLVPH